MSTCGLQAQREHYAAQLSPAAAPHLRGFSWCFPDIITLVLSFLTANILPEETGKEKKRGGEEKEKTSTKKKEARKKKRNN